MVSNATNGQSVNVVVERFGCNGVKSTWPAVHFDGCGVCGGKNECIDCIGVKNGST